MAFQYLNSICEQVYRRFPEVAGSQPSVHTRPGSQWMIIFHGVAKTADGRPIEHTIRVLASSTGRILKVTSSR